MTDLEPRRDDLTVTPADCTTPGQQLVMRYLATRRAANTRFAYGRDLGVRLQRPGAETRGDPRPARAAAWLDWCAAHALDPLGVVLEEHAGVWAREMEAAGLSNATVARKLAAVSSWYAWLVRGGHVAANPAKNLPRPYVNPDVSKTPGLTKEQAIALLAAADGAASPEALRNAALVYLLVFTGARVSEATGADVPDLGSDRGHRVLWVTSKGGGRDPLVVPPPAAARIDAYLETRGDVSRLPAVSGDTSARRAPLFIRKSGKRVTPAESWRIIRALARKAGFPAELVTRLGSHAMRHAYATLSLDAGASLRDLQDAMRHKDPRTTRRYDRARSTLDRAPGYALASYLAQTDEGTES